MRIGILGGGQLGRMLALAGYPLGIQVRSLDPAADAPAGVLSELIVGQYDDAATLARFADGVDVITYEFENVPVATARQLAQFCPVYPPPLALEKAQDRDDQVALRGNGLVDGQLRGVDVVAANEVFENR